MMWNILFFATGALFGVVIMCIFSVAGAADREMNEDE